jgi:hypothetical protein
MPTERLPLVGEVGAKLAMIEYKNSYRDNKKK